MIVMGLLGAALAGDVCADDADREANSAELRALYEQSLADREQRQTAADEVLKRDEKRAKTVVKMDKKGQLCTPQDKWYAGWLMQEADSLEVLERAYDLAVEAMQANVDRGPWLVAFAFDHKRTIVGYRQSYGTQTRVDAMGRRCLIELEGNMTDEDRRKYGVPSLRRIYRQVLDLNGKTDEPPTEARLKRNQLICPPLVIDKKDAARVQTVR